MEASKRNNKLNLLKGFACIGVVFIHIQFPGKIGKLISMVSAYAVPVFFLIAGYYAFGKGTDTLKRRLLKIIKIFVFAYLLFFVYSLLSAANNHKVVQWFADNYTITVLARYIIFCTVSFAIPLWYLLAQIETYIFWYFIVKLKKENIIVKCIPLLFIFYSVLTIVCETKGLAWFYKINFVTRSLSWFALGYYIHSLPKEKIEATNSKILYLFLILGIVIVCLPTLLPLAINISCIGYIPYAVALFLLSLKNSEISICKTMEFLGDKLSLYVYIFHVPVGDLSKMISEKILKIHTQSEIYLWLHPIITLWIVIIISYIFYIVITDVNRKNSNKLITKND